MLSGYCLVSRYGPAHRRSAYSFPSDSFVLTLPNGIVDGERRNVEKHVVAGKVVPEEGFIEDLKTGEFS